MSWLGLIFGLLGVIAVAAGLLRAFWPVAPGLDYILLDGPGRGDLERRVRWDLHRPGGEPGEDELKLLRTAAGIMIAQRNLIGVWLGCFLIQFGTTLAAWDSAKLLVTVLFGMGVSGLALYFERRAEAGAVFLARHPAPVITRIEPTMSSLGAPDTNPTGIALTGSGSGSADDGPPASTGVRLMG